MPFKIILSDAGRKSYVGGNIPVMNKLTNHPPFPTVYLAERFILATVGSASSNLFRIVSI